MRSRNTFPKAQIFGKCIILPTSTVCIVLGKHKLRLMLSSNVFSETQNYSLDKVLPFFLQKKINKIKQNKIK